MQLKFYTLAISLLAPMLAFAQIEAQSNQPKQKVAYLRFWNMLPPGNGTFDLRRLGAPPSEGMIAGKVPLIDMPAIRS